jgi:arylformamidase
MIYDISPPITEALWAWPGDVPFERIVSSDISRGDSFTLSSLHATAHLGAHADAPGHFAAAAQGIGERDLDYYLGPCQVLRVAPQPNLLITPRHIPGEIIAPRVLFATATSPVTSTRRLPVSQLQTKLCGFRRSLPSLEFCTF